MRAHPLQLKMFCSIKYKNKTNKLFFNVKSISVSWVFIFTSPYNCRMRTVCAPSCYCRLIFTTRKRSLRRLCFHRCLSVHGGGSSVQVGTLSKGGGVSVWESLARRSLSREYLHTTIGWGCLLGRPPGQRCPRTVKSERYASYWNAFLFSRIF